MGHAWQHHSTTEQDANDLAVSVPLNYDGCESRNGQVATLLIT